VVERKSLLAKELGASNEEAIEFAHQVRELEGYTFPYFEMLRVLKEYKFRKPITPQGFHEVLQADKYPDKPFYVWEARKYLVPVLPESTPDYVAELGVFPDSLCFLGPSEDQKEIWIGQEELVKIGQTLVQRGHTIDVRKMRIFSRWCWIEMVRNRVYQIPSEGRAEIQTFDLLKDLMGLRLIRFVQEGVRSPGVFLRFEFEEPSSIGIVKVEGNDVEGFHKLVKDERLCALVETITLSYYRDLVTPGKVYHSSSKGRRKTTSKPPRPKRPRPLPRPRVLPSYVTPIEPRQAYSLDEWYKAQRRARHYVTGHVRRIGGGFEASWGKKQLALEHGVILRPGETWVVEHEKGMLIGGWLELDGENLQERTLFLPPERASHELQELLL